MLGLASLLCIVFVAEATCNILPDGLAVSNETLEEMADSTRNAIRLEYEARSNSGNFVAGMFLFKFPYARPASFAYVGTEPNSNLTLPPSVECFEFMRSYIREDPVNLIFCTMPWFLEAESSVILMNEALIKANNRLENVIEAAKNGGTWYNAKFTKNSLVSVRIVGIKDKFAEILAEATANFNRHLETMTKVMHTWILAAGKYMCSQRGSSGFKHQACQKWAGACHESIGLLNNLNFNEEMRIMSPYNPRTFLISLYESRLGLDKTAEY